MEENSHIEVHEIIESEAGRFELSCRPLIRCSKCKMENPPSNDFCHNCGSEELNHVGLQFTDDLDILREFAEEYPEKPPKEKALSFILNRLEGRLALYEAFINDGWELAAINIPEGDYSGGIRFVKDNSVQENTQSFEY